jgi:hypothetical protein
MFRVAHTSVGGLVKVRRRLGAGVQPLHPGLLKVHPTTGSRVHQRVHDTSVPTRNAATNQEAAVEAVQGAVAARTAMGMGVEAF